MLLLKACYYITTKKDRISLLKQKIAQPREEITVAMPDGSERKAKSWETSPMDVAKDVSKSLSERIVIAKVCFFLFTLFHFNLYVSFLLFFRFKVDGELWDLDRPLEKSCKLELLDFEHPEGKLQTVIFFESWAIFFLTHFIYVRKKGFLAFFCSCSWRGCRETLWLSSMSRSSD